jgi:hypothetical protein
MWEQNIILYGLYVRQASNVVSGHAVKAQCHSFLASTLDGDGQLHAPVALPQSRPPCAHRAGGWVGPTDGLNVL